VKTLTVSFRLAKIVARAVLALPLLVSAQSGLTSDNVMAMPSARSIARQIGS
jgi:hypothetical protein